MFYALLYSVLIRLFQWHERLHIIQMQKLHFYISFQRASSFAVHSNDFLSSVELRTIFVRPSCLMGRTHTHFFYCTNVS